MKGSRGVWFLMRIKLLFALLAQNGNHQVMHNIIILGNQQHPICHLLKLYLWLLSRKMALFVFGLKIADLHAVDDTMLF